MDVTLKHKLIEIFVDKLLIGLIVLAAGLFVNSSLERYKLIEAQRVGDTTEFVKACQEIWSKVFEYETTIDEIESLRSSRWLYQKLGEKNLKNEDKKIDEKTASSKNLLADLRKSTDARKFVLGHQLVLHFWQYIGLVDMRADVKAKAREAEGVEAKESEKLVEDLNKRISSMRFSADIAREYAVSRMQK